VTAPEVTVNKVASAHRSQIVPTILIVEDHDDSREALAQLVGALGYHVLHAHDGAHGLRILATLRPTLILCDLRMPGIDGFGFIAAVQRDPNLADLKVVAVTALGDHGAMRRTWEAGFAGHLTKPINYDELMVMLTRMLGPPPRATGDAAA
jgi:CheY-like chemotaxis protein